MTCTSRTKFNSGTTLASTDQVDALGTDKVTGEAVLTLIDESPWDEESQHLALLQAKLNSYLRFIESGEITASYPDARGRKTRIDVVFQHAPTEAGEGFCRKVAQVISDAQIGFCWRVFQPPPR